MSNQEIEGRYRQNKNNHFLLLLLITLFNLQIDNANIYIIVHAYITLIVPACISCLCIKKDQNILNTTNG